jgi:hypothetical protein
MRKFITSLLKSLKWTLWNIFFGLLPAWIVLFLSWLDAKNVLSAGQEILIKENALMFFSVAVITAITIDVNMAIDSMNPDVAKKYRGIATWNNWASSAVVFISTLVYAQYYNKTGITEEVLANITRVSLGVFAFTMIYIFILKFYQIHYRPF